MTYRSDLDALDARHDALSNELARKTRELEQATKLLAHAKLPILDNIRVASPCRADWNAMLGDERVRHCNQCDKQVFNLSEMTRAEAEALIVEKNGDLCAKYYRRHDGTIITTDCRVGVVAARKRKFVAAASLALLGTGIGTAIQRHNRTEIDGIDNVDVPTAPEHVRGHFAAKAHNDAPPPKPEPEFIEDNLEMPTLGQMAVTHTMGAVAISHTVSVEPPPALEVPLVK